MPLLRQLPGSRAVRHPPLSRKTTLFQGFPGTSTGPFACDAFCRAFMKHQPLQYYMHDGPTAFRFELVGNLSREAARGLDQDWRTASSAIGDRTLIVDITRVTDVDEQGRALIIRWHREGARLIARSRASLALAESILGEPLPEAPVNVGAAAILDRRFRASFLRQVVILLLLATMVFPVGASAATLKPETVTAWDKHLQSASANLRDRLRPGGSFLWTFEDPSAQPKSIAARSSSLRWVRIRRK
jgi:ABC-type transporter Mla MlaB component